MTLDEIAEIERRCLNASDGPWESWVEGRDHLSGDSFIRTATDDEIYMIGVSDADQDFIAAAREDIPRLIAEIRRLRELESD